MWDFARLYGRALMTFKPAPAQAAGKLVPDLATALGTVSNDGQDLDLHAQAGREVRGRHAGHLEGRQVRGRAHAATGRAAQRPDVLRDDLLAGNAATYQGPYKDKRRTSWA